jgi:hypothetical protein
MFCFPVQTRKARKPHQCTWCSEQIEPGETYFHWHSVDDGYYSNKMHPECKEACNSECLEFGEDEYIAFQNERPEKLK